MSKSSDLLYPKVIKNIFKQRLLWTLSIVSLLATVIFPLRSYLFILPSFSKKLLYYTEEEALKTANHLTDELVSYREGKLIILPAFSDHIDDIMHDFMLEKIKIFDNTGTIIYSTESEDIGKINRHSYFHLIVAKGEPFSKIVHKDTKTLENRIVNRDVAEIYTPIMKNMAFVGAFELYYDLTARKSELDRMLWNEALFSTIVGLVMVGVITVMLFRASKAMIKQKLAEEKLYAINQNLEKIVSEKTKELRVTQEASIHSLAILAENYDPDTGKHIIRIRRITQELARLLRQDSPYSNYLMEKKGYIRDLAMASILHDIGKTSVPKEILEKPGRLTKDEFEIVKQHTQVAGKVLQQGNQIFIDQFGKDSYLALAADIAFYHHERWDGTGYPKGLATTDIPLSARIVAVADVYDALRSKRPYKDPWSHEKTLELILSESAKQFDPVLVNIFKQNHERFRKISNSI